MKVWEPLKYDPVPFLLQFTEPWIEANTAHLLDRDLPSSWALYKEFLAGMQNPDGGFPFHFKAGNPSGIHQTAYALWFHLSLDSYTETTAVRRAIGFLYRQQGQEGGWNERSEIIPCLPAAQQQAKSYWEPGSVFPPVPFDSPNIYFTAWIGKVCQALEPREEPLLEASAFIAKHCDSQGRFSASCSHEGSFFSIESTMSAIRFLDLMQINESSLLVHKGMDYAENMFRQHQFDKAVLMCFWVFNTLVDIDRFDNWLGITTYRMLRESQRPDGSWPPELVEDDISDPELTIYISRTLKKLKRKGLHLFGGGT